MHTPIGMYSHVFTWSQAMSEHELNKIIVFKNKNIRRILHQNQWWFSVVDVVQTATKTILQNITTR